MQFICRNNILPDICYLIRIADLACDETVSDPSALSRKPM